MARMPISAYIKYAALQHFARVRPEVLSQVPEPIWSEVAPVLLHFPDQYERDLAASQLVVGEAAKVVPSLVASALETALLEADPSGVVFPRKLRLAWNASLARNALQKVVAGELPIPACRDVLSSLIVAGRREAVKTALGALRLPLPQPGAGRDLAVAAGQALLAASSSQNDLDVVLAAIEADAELGRLILAGDTPHSESSPTPLTLRLNESQVARVYEWILKHPRSDQPSNSGFVGPEERLETLQRICAERLRTAGSVAAVNAIRGIEDRHPEWRWMVLIRDDAERSMRRVVKARVTTTDLFKLAEVRSRGYVSSEADLAAIVLTSLASLERELTGDDPLVRFLWNLQPLRHRDELDLSIFVTKHLRRELAAQGIVLNREVNISRVNQTDIRVEALARSSQVPTVALTVEVKGSWHPELKTAMETQLRDRYLAQGSGKTGIYLVGWFKSAAVPRERAPSMSITAARKFFASQAARLSAPPYSLRSFVLDCRWREGQRTAKKSGAD